MPPMPVSSVVRRASVSPPDEMRRLRGLLATYAISRAEFAEAAEMPLSYLQLLFKGVKPGPKTRAKIAHGVDALGLTTEWEAHRGRQ